MSEAIAFDAHRFVKRLTENGFTEKQAETLAEEHVALLNANLATKADVAAIDVRVARVLAGAQTRWPETRAGIARGDAHIDAVKSDFVKWLIGALIVHGGLVVALIKLL